MKDIILLDAGTGNLRSAQKALECAGANVERTGDAKKVLTGRKIVLPGVGAFGDFMAGLRARGLEDAIRETAARGVPLLGICVGMQALFETSEEMGIHAGLALLEGGVTRFAASSSLKVPHTGWNQLEIQGETPLFRGLRSGVSVYFNHSYFCQPRHLSEVIATTDYGVKFACAVQRESIFGVQFHPEKSQAAGLQILKNFLEAI